MGKGDHCAVYGCDNDRRYPEKYIVSDHVGILRFFSPKNAKDKSAWQKLINRKNFKVTTNTKVCSNHFLAGYRSEGCPNPTLYLKGYQSKETSKRLPPKDRSKSNIPKRKRRKILCEGSTEKSFEHQDKAFFAAEITAPEQCTEPESVHEDSPHINCTTDLDVTRYDYDDSYSFESDKHDLIDCFCQGNVKTLKRNLFIEQAICQKNCYRYTGLSLEKLNLVFSLIKEKAKSLRYWRGSTDTATAQSIKRGHVSRVLTHWEEFILTLVRTQKGFDVMFLADTFSVSASHVSRIYTTWVKFLPNELSFLVPWPSKSEIKEKLPKRFQKFKNLRIIIDCTEFFIQKPKIPGSQKISWSSYKHWNTAKLLVGITPTGIFSFIPPLWTGSISDKEIVTNSGLINLLEKGDGVMADKGFLVRDLLVVKKVHLISPAYCRGPILSSR
ncbi:uncharacterized protein LOC124438460 [Xenia sp. Carnegie-2017]|uniref:uncharacterized protein LOC124438460 n=1 Tax=Xenia sp. Carnegie-2017 TaxID=2897299 RepID=UPI001F03E471|nr:uncharacterized protein LOC124438460 [Xenia sp. Carnegie-2017]